jgi:hypothetical protein
VLAALQNKELENVTPYVDTYKEQELVEKSISETWNDREYESARRN